MYSYNENYERPSRSNWSSFNVDNAITRGWILPPWFQSIDRNYGWVLEGVAFSTYFKVHHGRDGKYRYYYRTRAGTYRLSATYMNIRHLWGSYNGDNIKRAHLTQSLWIVDRI